MTFSITFVLFPAVTQLDFTGPAEVLSRVPDAKVAYAGVTDEPISTGAGFSVLPTEALAAIERTDLVCVPGGFGIVEAIGDDRLIENLRRLARDARYVTSVCTGALVLGAAGLLEGKEATTHWAYHDLLPLVGATPRQGRVVRDGRLFTGGGVTAGIDFGLSIAAEVAGERTARTIATAIEYAPDPPFGQGSVDVQPDEVSTQLVERYRDPVEQARAAIAKVRRSSICLS